MIKINLKDILMIKKQYHLYFNCLLNKLVMLSYILGQKL